jgi:hypothetical protein
MGVQYIVQAENAEAELLIQTYSDGLMQKLKASEHYRPYRHLPHDRDNPRI